MALAQSAGLGPRNTQFRVSIRPGLDLDRLIPALSSAVRGVDAGLTFTFTPLERDLDASVAQERLLAMLAAVFGAIALLLCAIGLYGVSSYAATRRRAEIGIRLALGAPPQAVMRAMLARLGLLVLIGLSVGAIGALWLSRFIAPLLFGLAPRDPVTLFASAVVLVAVATAAAWIPAARATRLDPAQVLRDQ